MAPQPEVIVLRDSSDASGSGSGSEPELRIASNHTTARKSNKQTKNKAAAPVLFRDDVLSREERYLLQADDDESSDDDDDYDDGDASFGNGARAFARKRSRAAAAAPAAARSKRRKLPTGSSRHGSTSRPPAAKLTTAARRGSGKTELRRDACSSDDELSHSNLVRLIAEAREKRAKLAGKSKSTLSSNSKNKTKEWSFSGGCIKPHRVGEVREVDGTKVRVEISSVYRPKDNKQPQAARKSAPSTKQSVVPSSTNRRRQDDEDDCEDQSSESESEEEEEDEEEEEIDPAEVIPKRPTRRPVVDEIELSDEDSYSGSDNSDSQSESDSDSDAPLLQRSSSKTTKKATVEAKQPKPVRPLAKAKPTQAIRLSTKSSPKPTPTSAKKTVVPPRPPQRPAPAAAPQSKADIAQSSSARSSRSVVALSEFMSIEEMQAQERELAYFKQMQKRKELAAGGALPRPANAARKAVGGATNGFGLSRENLAASVDSSVSSVASREPKPLVRKKSPNAAIPQFVPPVIREGLSTATPNLTTVTVASAVEATQEYAEKDQIDHTPLLHNTAWRSRLSFARAPINLAPHVLSSHDGRLQQPPFANVMERELSEFDTSGKIPFKAEILVPPPLSTDDLLKQSYESQDSISVKVRRVIDDSLPVLEQCHQRRVQDMIASMRSSLPWSKSRRRPSKSRAAPYGYTEACAAPIELIHAKRIPRTKVRALNRLVGAFYYTVGLPRTPRDDNVDAIDDAVGERIVFPDTVIEFGENLTPMRRACAWISVKTNVHVEDDPILRYIPYLGDKTRVNIDPKRYQATTLDKQRAIIVELPKQDQDHANSDDAVVKQQHERLEHWRADAANLVSATRSAMDDEVMEYLLGMVVQRCGKSDKVFQALKEIGGFAEPFSDYDVIQKRHQSAKIIDRRLQILRDYLEKGDPDDTKVDVKVRAYVTQLVSQSSLPLGDDLSVGRRLQAPLSSFGSNYMRFPEFKGVRRGKTLGHVSEWYRGLFCRRCYSYDCQQHGIQHPQPSRRMDPLNPAVRKSCVGLTRALKMEQKPANVCVVEIDSSSSSSSDEGENEGQMDAATAASKADADSDGAAAAVDAADAAIRRRSGRSQTRVSSMATASLQVQEVLLQKERKKQQRKQAKQLQKLVRQVDDSEYLDDSYRDMVGQVMDVLLSSTAGSFCGAHCWKRTTPSTEAPPVELSEVGHLMLRKLVRVLGDNACVLARLLREPAADSASPTSDSCAAVYRFIEHEKQQAGDSLHSRTAYQDQFHDKADHQRPTHPHRSTASLHSGNRELVKRARMNRAQHQSKEHEHRYQPCNHAGVCHDANCDCLKRGHDCDKACSCSRDCANRNHGCKCLPGECRIKACSCYQVARECDPDFCFSCGAHEAAVMAFDDAQRRVSAGAVDICRNVSMLRGVHKKIGVAFSKTHGWGAYALEPICKDEFVYEYTGALISDDEAERRGSIYDAMLVSFLFDVNSDEVVDAMRKGNKIKFANHRMHEAANLDTKILVVRGEHRIALFAKWDLHVGEELFFDYGYTNETAPEWSQMHTPHNSRYAESDDDDELVDNMLVVSDDEHDD